MLLTINVPVTLILCGVTAVMIVFSILMNRKMHKVFTDNRKKIANVNAKVQDSLLGIKVIKSFATEEVEHKKFDTANDEFLRTKADLYRAMGSFHSINSFLEGMLYVSALVAGGYFFVTKDLNAMDFAIYFLYIGIFINPIDTLINFTELFQRGFSGFKRFIEVVETPGETEDGKDAKDLVVSEGNIEFKDVIFSYNEHGLVLDGVSLHVEKGTTVALVGPSGGGKSTICSLLPRFYNLSQGQITIDGQDIKGYTLKSLRRAIGIVQQDVYMFSGSVRENIAYGKIGATDEEIVEAAKKANIHDFIMSLPNGYNSYVGERGTMLSGGQKQRISIARVFLKDPKILILDEATSALDNESERHIQMSLEELAKNRTSIVIAHRLSTIKNADKIYVVAGGKIVEEGSHASLMQKGGLYAKYYNMQFQDIDDI